MAVKGDVRDLDAGRPLRVSSCDGPVALPAGDTELVVPGGDLRPHYMRLHSPAPAGVSAPTGGGRVVDPGDAGRGSHEGVRVAVDGPSWLVLGESWNRGWSATCDGRDLGEPEVVDGYANGWRIDRDCTEVDFTFGPQRAVTAAYVIGGIACLALLALLLASWRRRPAPVPRPPSPVPPTNDHLTPMPLRKAVAIALAIGLLGAFLFALRAGPPIALGTFLILWRGVPTRTLIVAAGALLGIVVPALYLLFPSTDRGGYNTEYATDHLGAHWVGVAALVLLVIALWRTLSTASRRRGGRAPEPADEAASRVPA